MNFQGINSEDVSYSEVDYNESYFTYFDKNGINIFLLIEPNKLNSNLENLIKNIILKYKSHKSIIGICIDLEWFPANSLISSEMIVTWLKFIKKYDSRYLLIIKHWNINQIEPYINNDVIYVQSMEGINTLEELKKRHSLWARTFFPCPIGLEVGFENDNYWKGIEDPISKIYDEIENLSSYKSSIFWNESSLREIIGNL